LPDFEFIEIIFYTSGFQRSQREIFPSISIKDHGSFASNGSTLKMHLLSDVPMEAALPGKHLPCRKNQAAMRPIPCATRRETQAWEPSARDFEKQESTARAACSASFEPAIGPSHLAFQRPLFWR